MNLAHIIDAQRRRQAGEGHRPEHPGLHFAGTLTGPGESLGETVTIIDPTSTAHGASFLVRPGDDISRSRRVVEDRFRRAAQ